MRLASKLAALATTVCLTALTGSANAADITVVATGGPLPQVMGVLGPMFEKASGHKVNLSIKAAPAIIKDVKEGASIDLIVSGDDTIDALIKDSLIAAGSSAKVMQSRVGLGVRTGAPKPDISTSEALKASLLAARPSPIAKAPAGSSSRPSLASSALPISLSQRPSS